MLQLLSGVSIVCTPAQDRNTTTHTRGNYTNKKLKRLRRYVRDPPGSSPLGTKASRSSSRCQEDETEQSGGRRRFIRA